MISSRYSLFAGGHGDVDQSLLERDGLAFVGVEDVDYG
jgi:hypothetical protein